MSTVAKRKQTGIRINPELAEEIREAAHALGISQNKWCIAAIREKLERGKKGQSLPPRPEPHHEDPKDEFERLWAHALIRRLRSPAGKARPVLDHLAGLWNL